MAHRLFASRRPVVSSGRTVSRWHLGVGFFTGWLLARLIAIPHPTHRTRRLDRELRDCEERLRNLASQVLLAEERERRALAVRLHDDVGQSLVVAKMRLDSLPPSPSAEQVWEVRDEVLQLIDEALGQARSLTCDLSPPILYEVGLTAALKWLAAQCQRRHGLSLEVNADVPPGTLGEERRILLYQVARELVMNIVKHARSTRASMTLSRHGSSVQLRVEDNGVGFCPEQVELLRDDEMKFGLFSIRERVTHYGGRFELRARPGEGTLIQIDLPIRAEPAQTEVRP